jgi:hypothetical protein
LIYGFLKLQEKIVKDPSLGWRERYRAEGTEEAAQPAPAAPETLARPEAEVAGPDAPRR